mmetsp:Transcript_36405/g.109263  ORF Transcript_36405/g.109263 Transcript_36405/m.109263 type:complete len:168 (+) Transcript_36405:69-572(+)
MGPDGLTLASGIPKASASAWLVLVQLLPFVFGVLCARLCTTQTGKRSAVILAVALAWAVQLHPRSTLNKMIPLEWDGEGSSPIAIGWYLAPAILTLLGLCLVEHTHTAAPRDGPSTSGAGTTGGAGTRSARQPVPASPEPRVRKQNVPRRAAIAAAATTAAAVGRAL